MTKDFFISYNSKDQQWAEWVATTLEDAGYSTVIQAWDFRPGENFVLEMQKATTGTHKTIAVLSQNYLGAEFTHPEWAAAFGRDPQGNERALIPVRIDNCKPSGLLASIIYADLYGLSEDDARQTLINALADRAKPDGPAPFPGSPAPDQPAPSASPPQNQIEPPAAVNWETLSGPQQGEFVEALLSAYGARGSMEQMLLFTIDVRLSNIAGGGNMREVATDVVTWAVENGKTKALYDGARERNPGNPALRQLEAKLLSMVPADTQSLSATPNTGNRPATSGAATTPSSYVGGDDITVRDIQDSTGVAIGRNNTVNVTHVHNYPPERAPFPGQETSSSAGGSVLAI